MYLFTNWKFSDKIRRFMEEGTDFNVRMLLVITKYNFGMGGFFRNQHELCWVADKGENPTYKLKNFSNVMAMPPVLHDQTTHPHQKHTEILAKMIRHSSNEGDLVYDAFMGSGTTARACKDLGRNYIGSEISKEYCDIAEKRLRQEVLL